MPHSNALTWRTKAVSSRIIKDLADGVLDFAAIFQTIRVEIV